MTFSPRANSVLRRQLGNPGVEFLQHGLGGLTRILPHVDASNWTVDRRQTTSVARFADQDKRQLRLDLALQIGSTSWAIGGKLERRKAPAGVGSIPRTISA